MNTVVKALANVIVNVEVVKATVNLRVREDAEFMLKTRYIQKINNTQARNGRAF